MSHRISREHLDVTEQTLVKNYRATNIIARKMAFELLQEYAEQFPMIYYGVRLVALEGKVL